MTLYRGIDPRALAYKATETALASSKNLKKYVKAWTGNYVKVNFTNYL